MIQPEDIHVNHQRDDDAKCDRITFSLSRELDEKIHAAASELGSMMAQVIVQNPRPFLMREIVADAPRASANNNDEGVRDG